MLRQWWSKWTSRYNCLPFKTIEEHKFKRNICDFPGETLGKRLFKSTTTPKRKRYYFGPGQGGNPFGSCNCSWLQVTLTLAFSLSFRSLLFSPFKDTQYAYFLWALIFLPNQKEYVKKNYTHGSVAAASTNPSPQSIL